MQGWFSGCKMLGLKKVLCYCYEALTTRLTLNSMVECYYYMEEKVWSDKCRTFKVSGSFTRQPPRKNME